MARKSITVTTNNEQEFKHVQEFKSEPDRVAVILGIARRMGFG